MNHLVKWINWPTCVVQQNVLWLQVPVDDPVLMKMLQPTDNLSCVKPCSLLIKTWILLVYIIHVKSED